MGVVKCRSPFETVDCLGSDGTITETRSARQLLPCLAPSTVPQIVSLPLSPINHESTTAGFEFPAWRFSLHGPKTRNGVPMCRCTPSPGHSVYSTKPFLNTDCGAKNEIRPREPIRCRECGHRIMYKKRTRRSKLFFSVDGC
jgi:DNA-directed RNA polymerase subunit RPC12/RpoP